MRLTPNYDAAPRGAGVLLVVVLHLVILGGLLQIEAVRSAVSDAAPLFVSFITPDEPKLVVPDPPVPKVVPKKEPPRLVTTTAPVLSPVEFSAPPAPIEPIVVVPEVAPAPAIVAPATASPKVVTGVEYIRPPRVEYPAISRRLHEQGRVLLRVLINRAGHAERVEVQASSGSPRLDQAAVKAAREALYRPHTEDGEAIPVWALVPTLFELS